MSGARARSPWWEVSTGPSLDVAGRVIAFSSRHPIDPSDLKHDFDLFVEEIPVVRERTMRIQSGESGRVGSRRTVVHDQMPELLQVLKHLCAASPIFPRVWVVM